MRKADVKIGDTLTLKAETYGQSFVPYAKTRDEGIKSVPNKIITPGMVGIVASVDVPSPTRNRSFICLDFIVDGITYRTRPWYDEVKPVKAERPEAHQFCGVWYAGKE